MMEDMEDERYARELFAILTNPHPAGIDPEDPYGLPEDGIDRYSCFGRDVWVQSVKVADGQYGAELAVEFGLALPSDPDVLKVPPRGGVRLPFDAQWRELSGYLQKGSLLKRPVLTVGSESVWPWQTCGSRGWVPWRASARWSPP